jgi:hypothetical protein
MGNIYKIHSISILSRGEHDKGLTNLAIYTSNTTEYDYSRSTKCSQYNENFCLGEAKSVLCKSTARSVILQKEVVNAELAFCELVVGADFDDGKYGRNCWNTCGKCKQKVCDKLTGTCLNNECMPGYYPSSCQQKCNPGFYGDECANRCSVFCQTTCNHINGECDCKIGYTGPKCDKNCSFGKYGAKCALDCPSTCKDSFCNNVNTMVTNAPISALVTVGMVKCVTNLMAAAF